MGLVRVFTFHIHTMRREPPDCIHLVVIINAKMLSLSCSDCSWRRWSSTSNEFPSCYGQPSGNRPMSRGRLP